MKVRIDREECTSCEVCWTVCPEVFEQNPTDSLSQIVEKLRVGGQPGLGEAGEDLRGCAQDAADSCPVSIIHVE